MRSGFIFLFIFLLPFNGKGQCSDWDRFIAIPNLFMNDAVRDSYGNLYVVGSIQKTIQVGNVTLVFDGSSLNGFILKFDKNNSTIWGKVIGKGQNSISKIVIDNSDNVLVSGYFYSSFIDWDCIRLQNTSSRSDVYIAKLSSAGTTMWAENFAGTNDESVTSLKIAPNNDIILAGIFVSSSLQFNAITIANKGGFDSFVARLSNSGSVLWAKDIGGSGSGNYPDYVWETSVDSKGNVIIGGWFESPVLQIDNFFFNATAISTNYFLAKIDSTGKTIWAKGPEVVLNYGLEGLVIDANDNIYATGNYINGNVSFGGITLTNKGSADIFLVKYDPNGTVLWAKGIGGTKYETGSKIALDQLGYLYLTGYFYSNTLTIGADTFTKAEFQSDVFLTKLNQSGNILCSKRTHGNAEDFPLSIFIDKNNNVFLHSMKLIGNEVYFDNTFSNTDASISSTIVQLGTNNVFSDDASISKSKINLGRDTTLCPGAKLKLEAGLFCNAVYKWSTNNSANSSIEISAPGEYWVDVLFNGSHFRDTIKINYYSQLILNLGKDIKKCSFNSINLNVAPMQATISWNDGTNGFQKLIKDPGKYWAIAQNKCGQIADTIIISNFPPLQLDLGPDRKICDSLSVKLIAGTKEATYTWNDGDHHAFKDVVDSGTYWVTAVNDCEVATDTLRVDFINPTKLFFPNVITPNEDTKNEFYIVDEVIMGSEFEVFNRWGQSVYYSKNYQNNWNADGLSTGNYFYVVKKNCKHSLIKGFVTVLR